MEKNRFDGYEGYYNATTSETNAFGDVGEALFKQVFEARGHKVVDHAKDVEWQLSDCDFEVITKSKHNVTVEVKWDDVMARTNNMCVECASDGWLKQTKAQAICYGDARNELFYMFYTSSLKKYIYENECNLRKVFYPSKAWLVNISDFMSWCINEDVMFWKIDIANNKWINKGC